MPSLGQAMAFGWPGWWVCLGRLNSFSGSDQDAHPSQLESEINITLHQT